LTFEETWVEVESEDRLIVKTNPRHQSVHRYEFHRKGDAWVPDGVVTGHALEYARNHVDEPVLDRRLADGQLQLSDFSETVADRSAVHAVA
jgi:hypothetical protein